MCKIGMVKEQKEFKDSRFWEVELEQEGQSEGEEGSARIVVVESEGRQKKTAAIFERRLEKVRHGFHDLERQVAMAHD